MTRRWFFQALAGATALIGSARRMVAKPKPLTATYSDPTEIILRKGDRLSVEFAATPDTPYVHPSFTVQSEGGVPAFAWVDRAISGQTFWRAPSALKVTKMAIYFSGNPAPVLWTKTSAGK